MISIYKNKIDKYWIKSINKELDQIKFKDSLWIFPGENPLLYKKVQIMICKNRFLKKIIGKKDNYIVLRLVNENDKKRSFEAHFDNYIETFYIPLLIPKNLKRIDGTRKNLNGDLYFWEKARKMPKNILSHIISKGFFQNFLTQQILKNCFLGKFKTIRVDVGDILRFNGFTTLHYNSPVSSEHRSLVIHNTMPFHANRIAKLIDNYSRIRVRKK